MRWQTCFTVGLLSCAIFSGVRGEEAIKPIPGVGPVGPLELVHDGLKFAEGPAADARGQLFLVDVRSGLVLRLLPDGKLETVVKKSQGINGMMFDLKGRLIGCQAGPGRIVAIDVSSGRVTPVASEYHGHRFIAPNDLVVDHAGGVYFTDPRFGRGNKHQDKQGVYYVSADGTATRLIDDLKFPNGIALSPDNSTLYVLPYRTPELMAYKVESPGKLGPGRALYTVPVRENSRSGGGDGMTLDTRGNLYLTAPAVRAICVVRPDGKELGRIPLPQTPTNCVFGGPDFKTLYVTTYNRLYALPMEAQGYSLAASKNHKTSP